MEYVPLARLQRQPDLLRRHTRLGTHPQRREALLVPDLDREAGMRVMGKPGFGKSAFMETLIYNDAAKKRDGIVVVDAHGDLVTNVLAALPAHRLRETYLLDMSDAAFPFAVNPFAHAPFQSQVEYEQAVDRILNIFTSLWPEVQTQQYLPLYVQTATIALLNTPGSTLVDMARFLTDQTFRQQLLARVDDDSVHQFWRQHDALSPSAQQTRIQALIGRLGALFTGRALVRNIVGQRATSLDFRRAIERREILLINLPVKTLKQNADLVGKLLVTQLHAALFSFGDTPPERRPGFSLYIDEFEHFTTKNIEEMWTEGRKFRIKLTVAHQGTWQLPDDLKAAALTARTQVCFQLTTEDGPRVAAFFPGAGSRFEVNERPVSYLLTHEHPDDAVRHFVDYYLRPLRGNRQLLKVTDTTLTWDRALLGLIHAPLLNEAERVPDPLYPLNSLFLEVMRRGNARVAIPREIAIGFSGCGRHAFLRAAEKARAELLPTYPLPNWLRQRDPEDGGEQLIHFVASLRVALDGLAEQPIGEAKPATPAEVGRMLTQLPKRTAWVRSSEGMGAIVTDDTPPRLTGAALQQRLDTVLDQTRRKYCRPREDVESGTTPRAEAEMEPKREMRAADAPAPEQDDTRAEPPQPPQHSHWDELLEDY